MCLNISNITIVTVKGAYYCGTIHAISKFDASHLFIKKFSAWWLCVYIKCTPLKSILERVYDYYFDNLIKTKKIEIKNILINEKNYKD